MFYEFLQRAFIGGFIVSILCGFVGCFMILKKSSFISDAVAHGSLTGIAIGLVVGWQPLIFALITAVLMSVFITKLKDSSKLSPDTIIGITYSVMFALGILIINLNNSYQPELSSFLFGSILSITWNEILMLFISSFVVIGIIYWKMKPILLTILDSDFAKLNGTNVKNYEYLINIAIAITVVLTIKLVGIILTMALLIIPAATAKLIAKNLSQMLRFSVFISVFITIFGIFLSFTLDIPTSSAIVLVGGGVFGFVTYLTLTY